MIPELRLIKDFVHCLGFIVLQDSWFFLNITIKLDFNLFEHNGKETAIKIIYRWNCSSVNAK